MSNKENEAYFKNLLGKSATADQSTKNSEFTANVPRAHRNCLANVVWCAKYCPIVRLMIDALADQGCEVRLERHVSCEPCAPGADVTGGFDQLNKQLVICENNVLDTATCCEVLAHELVHAFDTCRARFDVTNLRHVACTEIRAYNLLQCSFDSAQRYRYASFSKGARKKECVKRNALKSVMIAHKVDEAEALRVINEVFEPCYADLSPVWRHIRPKSYDGARAYFEFRRFNSDVFNRLD